MFQELSGTDSTGVPVSVPLAALVSGAPLGAVAQASAWMTATKAVLAPYGIPMWADWARHAALWQRSTAKETVLNLRDIATPLLTTWTKRIMRDESIRGVDMSIRAQPQTNNRRHRQFRLHCQHFRLPGKCRHNHWQRPVRCRQRRYHHS